MTAALGFGIGHSSYAIYLPIWLVNVVLMAVAIWVVGLRDRRAMQNEDRSTFWASLFLIFPWMLISIFAGMGPPPETPAGWVATATEQQVRYSFLAVSGVSVGAGFMLLGSKLRNMGEKMYSTLGMYAISLAIPLFVLNMLFWGAYLPEYIKMTATSGLVESPEWFRPVRALFGAISIVEVALIYLTAIAFALSQSRVGWLSRRSGSAYVILGSVGSLLIVSSAFLPDPFKTIGFAVSIPAIPLIMPYFMGVALLRRSEG